MTRFALLCLCMMTLVSCQSAADRQRAAAQQAWEDSLTPDQKIRLEAARLQALGLALSGGPIFRTPSATVAPMPTYGPKLNCFTNEIGNSVYTNCY